MPRVTFENESLSENDFPDDFSFSHLKNCTVIGDFAGKKGHYTDWPGCTVQVDFTGADIRGMESYKADFDGSTFTEEQASVCGPDIIRGYILDLGWQFFDHTGPARIRNMPRSLKQKILSVSESHGIPDADLGSWVKLARLHRQQTVDAGYPISNAQIRAAMEAVYPPKLRELMAQEFAGHTVSRERVLRVSGNVTEAIPAADWSQDMKDAAANFDRWQLSQHAEAFLAARYDQQAHAACRKLTPFMDFVAFIGPGLGRKTFWD